VTQPTMQHHTREPHGWIVSKAGLGDEVGPNTQGSCLPSNVFAGFVECGPRFRNIERRPKSDEKMTCIYGGRTTHDSDETAPRRPHDPSTRPHAHTARANKPPTQHTHFATITSPLFSTSNFVTLIFLLLGCGRYHGFFGQAARRRSRITQDS
jgi:hypothetical protein